MLHFPFILCVVFQLALVVKSTTSTLDEACAKSPNSGYRAIDLYVLENTSEVTRAISCRRFFPALIGTIGFSVAFVTSVKCRFYAPALNSAQGPFIVRKFSRYFLNTHLLGTTYFHI